MTEEDGSEGGGVGREGETSQEEGVEVVAGGGGGREAVGEEGGDEAAECVVGNEGWGSGEWKVGDRTGAVTGVEPPLDGGAVERVAGG